MSRSQHIAVLPGDGIGGEVMAAACNVLREAGKKIGVSFELDEQKAGAQHYLDSGVALPDETLAVCDRADAILFGAMGLPHVRGKDGTEIIPQLDLRFHFDLYAGVRPIKTFGALPLPLAHAKSREIDLVLVRENTEGLFYARGRGDVKRDASGEKVEVFDTMRITRKGTERICEFAFALAEQRAAKSNSSARVTNVDKANVFESMAFFREVFEGVAAKHVSVSADSAYVDAVALNLVLKPWTFDVLVTENMFGDILSDLIAALVGGMGMAPSADIGDKHGLFQPAHGTAPDIAGQGKANPTAMILSAAMMLQWIAIEQDNQRLADGAVLIETAVEKAFSSGDLLPFEFGGSHGTKAITEKVLSFVTA
jgi:3-isopropylmalate dehydrogenase